jgi:hypothetical protein
MANLNWWFGIQNVQSGRVMDVQGNAKTAGTTVWPYSLNYTDAQIFRVDTTSPPRGYGDDACYIKALNAGGPNLYLSVKTPPLVIVAVDTTEPAQPGTVPSDVILPRMVADQPSDKRVLRNYAFSIAEKRVPSATSPISVLTDLSVPEGPPKQVWKLVPVPGEEDIFFIECADFEGRMVVESLDLSSGGTLVLSSFTGADIQKWRIVSTAPPNATNLKLADFTWAEWVDMSPLYAPWKWSWVRIIQGKLSWTNPNPSALRSQVVSVSVDGDDFQFVAGIEPNRSSYDFKVPSSKAKRTKEHCFVVWGRSKWQSNNLSLSDEVCGIPTLYSPAQPEPTTPKGIGKLLISNCHSEKKPVHLWSYDLTANTGVWKDEGTVAFDCPDGTPKEVSFGDSHVYTMVGIDCGDMPPNQAQSSCWTWTLTAIQGEKDGASLPIKIGTWAE